MNRTFAKRGLQSIVAMFLLVGAMLFTASQATAQKVKTTSSSAQISNLANSTDAVAILMNQIENAAHPQLKNAQPGTQQFEEWTARAYYWKRMIAMIGEGTTVSAALSDAARETLLVNHHDAYTSVYVDRTFMNTLYDFTYNLLKQ